MYKVLSVNMTLLREIETVYKMGSSLKSWKKTLALQASNNHMKWWKLDSFVCLNIKYDSISR